jgi:peroxiredoxin
MIRMNRIATSAIALFLSTAGFARAEDTAPVSSGLRAGDAARFRDLHAEFEKKGVVILGVSHDKPDTDGEMSKAYGAVMPKNPAFSRRNTHVIGKDGKVEKVLVDVNAGKHPKELLEAHE